MTENSSSSNPRNVRLTEGDMSENRSSPNPRDWKGKRAAIRAAKAAMKPEGPVAGSTGATESDDPHISPPSRTVPVPSEGSSSSTEHPGVERTQSSTVETVEAVTPPAEAQEPSEPNSNDEYLILGSPPSPTQLSISLYSLPNIEGTSEDGFSEGQDLTSMPSAIYVRAPLPREHVVPLYALSDVSQAVDNLDDDFASITSPIFPPVEGAAQNRSFHDHNLNEPATPTFWGIPEVPPSPAQLSIELYALPSIVEHLDDGFSGDQDPMGSTFADYVPSPVRHNIPLYSLTKAQEVDSTNVYST